MIQATGGQTYLIAEPADKIEVTSTSPAVITIVPAPGAQILRAQ